MWIYIAHIIKLTFYALNALIYLLIKLVFKNRSAFEYSPFGLAWDCRHFFLKQVVAAENAGWENGMTENDGC